MPAIQRASYRRHTCCTGMAHSNPGITRLFTWICGRGGSFQTPPEDSPWYDLTARAEVCGRLSESQGRNQVCEVQDLDSGGRCNREK